MWLYRRGGAIATYFTIGLVSVAAVGSKLYLSVLLDGTQTIVFIPAE